MADQLVANLVIFVRLLRAAGLAVRQGGLSDALAALADIGIERRTDVHDALRAVLIVRREDLARFDELFTRFWRTRRRAGDPNSPTPMQLPARARSSVRFLGPGLGESRTRESDAAADGPEKPVARATFNQDEMLRRRDFAALTAAEITQAERIIARLTWNTGFRRTRRWKSGDGRSLDLRRLVRANARYGGEMLTLPRRQRTLTSRPLILICDVSGSMEPYTRMLLLFAHALSARGGRVEVFVFSTRLTRVTRQFAVSSAQTAVSRVRDAVRDWSGGTRIGQAIRTFNTAWARRVLRRQPVVLVISDGWDLGEPEILAREMAWLQRSVYRLIWLNPLIGSQDYAPLTRGLQAALPFVDDFLSARNISSLEALAQHLESLGTRDAARGQQERGQPGRGLTSRVRRHS